MPYPLRNEMTNALPNGNALNVMDQLASTKLASHEVFIPLQSSKSKQDYY